LFKRRFASQPLWAILLLSIACAGDASPSFGKSDQHRELRVQRALRSGDLTPSEAAQLRQRWERARRERQESAVRERAVVSPKRNDPEPAAAPELPSPRQ